jgi:hypothetical protein
MSIELNRRVKELEQQLAEVNRQIAQIQAQTRPAQTYVAEPEKRKPGRPPKNG